MTTKFRSEFGIQNEPSFNRQESPVPEGYSPGEQAPASLWPMVLPFSALLLAVMFIMAYIVEFHPGMAPDTYRSIVSPTHPAVSAVRSPWADENAASRAELGLEAPSGKAIAAEPSTKP